MDGVQGDIMFSYESLSKVINLMREDESLAINVRGSHGLFVELIKVNGNGINCCIFGFHV